jgi:hypothetical protein
MYGLHDRLPGVLVSVEHVPDRGLRDDERVSRLDRIYVEEGERQIVFVYDARGNLPAHDLHE